MVALLRGHDLAIRDVVQVLDAGLLVACDPMVVIAALRMSQINSNISATSWHRTTLHNRLRMLL